MSDFNLSTLSGPELRGLLDSTRKRGQAAQAYQILKEMAERREDGSASASRPRVIAVDLGDPLERREEPPALAARPETEAPLTLDPQWEPTHRRRPRQAPPRKPRDEARGPRRRRRWPAVGFVAGVALGVTLGAGLAVESLSPPEAPSSTIFPAAPMLRVEPAISQPAAPPAAAPETVAAIAAPPAPAALDVAQAAAPASTTAPAPVPAPVPTEDSPPASETMEAEAAPCAGAATPADRAICGDPALHRLQGELRQVYAEALAAHADRALLRQRQLAWREARNDVADPERLARLYETRIRRLEAAAAAARAAR